MVLQSIVHCELAYVYVHIMITFILNILKPKCLPYLSYNWKESNDVVFNK